MRNPALRKHQIAPKIKQALSKILRQLSYHPVRFSRRGGRLAKRWLFWRNNMFGACAGGAINATPACSGA
jgi:hypothetical protein